ncbi:MAG: inositol monophosphatase family protein [Pseudomonadota bacterium]
MVETGDFTPLLHELAESAESAILPHVLAFQRAVGTLSNKDQSGGFDPVTEADRAAERAIRHLLLLKRPEDAVTGEEFGAKQGTSDIEWVIDPIDGTRAFIAGLTTWGTIIGAVSDGDAIAGLFCQALTRERFWGENREAWYTGPRTNGGAALKLSTSPVDDLASATLMTTSPRMFSSVAKARYDAVEARVRLARYGADGYAYCLLAAGQIDLVIEDDLKPYDIAGLIPIIEGAGGVVTDWAGERVPIDGGDVIAAANPVLHREAVLILNGRNSPA